MPWSKAPDAFKRAEASWRRMLVAQPPVQTARITQTINSFMCNSERHGVLKDSDMPLRMGGLYDLALSFLDEDDTCFRISWRRNTEDQPKMEDEPKMEGDIILQIVVEQGCLSPIEKWTMDEQFFSDGAKPMEIVWGQWD